MSDPMPSQFSWEPIHLETARKLRAFRNRSGELVAILQRMHEEDLRALPIMDKDAAGNVFLLEAIDPFTFLANFNRGVTDGNRRALWDFLKREWNLESPIPEDFHGIPLANLQNSWLIPYLPKRDDDHIPLLWEFFEHILDAEPKSLDTDLMDRCLAKHGVGMAFLSMGMFWAKPDVWVAADGKNVEFARTRGLEEKPTTGTGYRDWCGRLIELVGGEVLRFSHEAHLWATEKGVTEPSQAEMALPFRSIFKDEEQARQVFDVFQEVILHLQDGEASKTAVLNTTVPGSRHFNLNYIVWPALTFGYPKSDQWQVIFSRERARELVEEIPDVPHQDFQKNPFTHFFLTTDQLKREPVWKLYLAALDELKLFYEKKGRKKSSYNRHHVPALFDAIMAPEKRNKLLYDGLPGKSGIGGSSGQSRPLWVIAPGESGKLWPEWFASGIASIGWNDTGDLTGLDEIEAFREAVAAACPDAGADKVGRMIHDFALGMEPGDIVVAKEGTRAVLGWGVVSTDYRFDTGRVPYHHLRDVKWMHNERAELAEPIRLPNKTLTGYRDSSANRPILDALAAIYDFSSDAETLIDQVPRYTRDDALRDLFVDPAKLDQMMALLRRKKNLILQGAPGTGKTFIARRLAYLLMGARDESRAPMIQFHQSTSYEDFIQGFRPDNEGRFLLRNGVFHDFCRSAGEFPDEPHVFLIDEINRGNLSKILGELMLLIEPDKRGADHAIRLAYGDAESEPFFVPSNVYLVGTMNTADRSLSLVDYALRRRFAFVEMEPGFHSSAFAAALERRGVGMPTIDRVRSTMSALNEMIEGDGSNLGRGYRIGHSFFTPTRNITDEEAWYREVLDFEILPLVDEYWADDPKGLEKARGLLRI